MDDLARLDANGLQQLDEGIRAIRAFTISVAGNDRCDWEIHPMLVALLHRLDVRYEDGMRDADEHGGWNRWANDSYPADDRIRGLLSSRRGVCVNHKGWQIVVALDTVLEICRWRNIID